LFLVRNSDGQGPTIDTLKGAENLDAIADIEYFKKKMAAGFKIPFNRLGIGDQTDPNGKSLAQSSPEFAKNVQWIQREVAMGLKKLTIVHLALRGHNINEIKEFDLHMTSASAIDELYRIETWNTRTDIMANLKEIGWFSPEWIIERFTDMSPDEVQELKALKQSKEEMNESASVDNKKLLSEYTDFISRQRQDKKEYNSGLKNLISAHELDGLEAEHMSAEDTKAYSDMDDEFIESKKLCERLLTENVDEDVLKISESIDES
jgi:hypothetical protein